MFYFLYVVYTCTFPACPYDAFSRYYRARVDSISIMIIYNPSEFDKLITLLDSTLRAGKRINFKSRPWPRSDSPDRILLFFTGSKRVCHKENCFIRPFCRVFATPPGIIITSRVSGSSALSSGKIKSLICSKVYHRRCEIRRLFPLLTPPTTEITDIMIVHGASHKF